VITAIVLGLGDRGKTYSDYGLSNHEKLKIVAVADSDEKKRKHFETGLKYTFSLLVPSQNE
jgi:hypothetical protein